MAISFTLDLEDHTSVYEARGRWVRNTEVLLDFCAQRKIRGTFFAVGRAAENASSLLRKIVAQGHELELHSHDHIPLTREDPKTYGAKLDAAKKKFEDITGKKIEGFRAPVFSLTPESYWVVEVLKQLDFLYSSSVIAGKSLFAGFPGAPDTPFQWPNGLIELPVPALKIGPAALPFLGGVYLRYLPLWLVRKLQVASCKLQKKTDQAAALETRNSQPETLLWTYLHPYDIDADEGFTRLEDGTPLWANLLLMNHRRNFLNKLSKLLENNAAPPLGERARALHDLPRFRPT